MTTEPEKQTKSQELLKYFEREIERNRGYARFVNNNHHIINEINVRPSFYADYCDFDQVQRPIVTAIIKAFGGKWNKAAGYNGGIHYTRDQEVDGLTVRIYNGEPPPSCRIEEVVEYVDVPAHTERRVTRKVVCPEPNLEEIAGNQSES